MGLYNFSIKLDLFLMVVLIGKYILTNLNVIEQ